MSFLPRFRKHKPADQMITVVSGLPRSGTSMMMQILQAGGMPILTDQVRQADEDNPRGYYEYERVKKLKEGDTEWLSEARGKAVKIVSALLEYLPPQYAYKVIFMERDIAEIIASQNQMLIRRGETADQLDDNALAEVFDRHLRTVKNWLKRQPHMDVLYVCYAELLRNPSAHIRSLVRFLGLPLDVTAMLLAPDARLYRQRR